MIWTWRYVLKVRTACELHETKCTLLTPKSLTADETIVFGADLLSAAMPSDDPHSETTKHALPEITSKDRDDFFKEVPRFISFVAVAARC